MADLGAIGRNTIPANGGSHVSLSGTPQGVAVRSPQLSLLKTHDERLAYFTPVLGHLSGVVTENGVPVVHAVVRCYYRATGVLVAQAHTAADGAWTIVGVDAADTGAYYVIALDPAGGVQYNALVYDRVTPTA